MPEKHFYLRNIIQTKDNLRLSDKSKETLSETKAVNTVDAYESDWNDFVTGVNIIRYRPSRHRRNDCKLY